MVLVKVWDGISDSRIEFSASQLDLLPQNNVTDEVPQMSRLTENINLQRALLRCLDNDGTISIIDNVKVSGIVNDKDAGGWPLVHTTDGGILRARLLVNLISTEA